MYPRFLCTSIISIVFASSIYLRIYLPALTVETKFGERSVFLPNTCIGCIQLLPPAPLFKAQRCIQEVDTHSRENDESLKRKTPLVKQGVHIQGRSLAVSGGRMVWGVNIYRGPVLETGLKVEPGWGYTILSPFVFAHFPRFTRAWIKGMSLKIYSYTFCSSVACGHFSFKSVSLSLFILKTCLITPLPALRI